MTDVDTSGAVLHRYLLAKAAVIEAGFEDEVAWQENLAGNEVTDSDFMREAAWVVLSSGMRESVVRAKFPKISNAFWGWRSPRRITADRGKCRRTALRAFNHPAKIDAILDICETVDRRGAAAILTDARAKGVQELCALPHIGPVTVFHLARNLGFMVSKPDRHLQRIAVALAAPCVASLCGTVAEQSGDPVSVVDLVLWRYATIQHDYVRFFSRARESSAAASTSALSLSDASIG